MSLALLVLAPVLAAALLAGLGARAGRRGLAALAALAMLATAALAAAAAPGADPARLAVGAGLVLELAVDARAQGMALLVPAVALPIVLFAAAHEAEAGLARLVALLVAFVGAMQLLVVAADLLTLLAAWELVGALSFALIAHGRHEPGAPAAATRAFLVTRAGDLGLFVAAAALYAGTESFAYRALPELAPELRAVVAGGVVLAAAAKSAQVPFAPWLFDAMHGPSSVSALLHAATMVAAGVYLLARLEAELAPVPGFSAAVIGIGLATALAGGLVALLQPHAKRLLAASTSAQYGLMWTALGAGHPAVALLHLAAHAAAKALLFLAVGVAGQCAGSFRLERLRVGRALPRVAAAAALGALALAGVPPLGAGWTKEALVASAGSRGAGLALALAAAGALSAAYAARLGLLGFGPGRARRGALGRAGRLEGLALALLALACLALSAWGAPGLLERTVRALGGSLPEAPPWERGVSLALVALGLAAGLVLAWRRPRLGARGRTGRLADWIGLPRLGSARVATPGRAAARALAAWEDRCHRAAVHGMRVRAGGAARSLARADADFVHGTVRALAEATARAAALAAGPGESLSRGLADAAARPLDAGGRGLRRLHTGLVHQSYALLASGLAALAGLLLALGAAG